MGRGVAQRIVLGPGPRRGRSHAAGELLAESLGLSTQPLAGAVDPLPGACRIDADCIGDLVHVDLRHALGRSADLPRERPQHLVKALMFWFISAHEPMMACRRSLTTCPRVNAGA